MINLKTLLMNKPALMGVINCSPNSFFAPVQSFDAALRQAEQMLAEGADMLDIGGEATNPQVNIARDAPSIQAEIDRVVPVIEAIKQRFECFVSVDTSQAAVMQAAINAGVDMINDQRSLQQPDSLDVVASSDVAICLMHFPLGRIPQSNTMEALLLQVKSELLAATERCIAAGIGCDRIVIDPGFGQGNYGKNVDENYYLLAHMNVLVKTGFPVLSGWSRKSMIGDVLGGVPAAERLYGSVASAVLAAVKGASIIRVHDVKATRDALKICQKMREMEV